MANNYLITGYWGEPHVTAENDRGINAAIFGTGRFVLPVGKEFRAEYIGNNTIRLYDGKLMNNGAAGGIPAGEYVDLLIANASQGMKRNDLIVFQYSRDASTLIESGTFVVIQGAESSGTASDPTLTQGDLLSGETELDQMPLWRVSVSGGTISAPVQVFERKNKYHIGEPYISANSTSPASLFGGTWERLKDRFILAAGDTYAAGSTGGEATHTLTIDEMPSHAHGLEHSQLLYTDYSAAVVETATAQGVYNVKGATSITSNGGNQPHNNMPPYQAFYVWIRIA